MTNVERQEFKKLCTIFVMSRFLECDETTKHPTVPWNLSDKGSPSCSWKNRFYFITPYILQHFKSNKHFQVLLESWARELRTNITFHQTLC